MFSAGGFYFFEKNLKKRLTFCTYRYILITETRKTPKRKGYKDMTKAERIAIKARENDLIKAGVEKEIAKVMAKVEFETGLIKVVVNYN